MSWRDPTWKYTPASHQGDGYLRKRFAAELRRIAAEKDAEAQRLKQETEERAARTAAIEAEQYEKLRQIKRKA